jgi:hypothetical protein
VIDLAVERERWRALVNAVMNLRVPLIEGKSVPVTGLEWPRGFQEVKAPRLHYNGTGWW